MPNPQEVFNMLAAQNPQAANSPIGRQFAQILQSGDVNSGMSLANNILQNMNMTEEQGIGVVNNAFASGFFNM